MAIFAPIRKTWLMHLTTILLTSFRTRADNWWHISTQQPPNVGSSIAISEPIIAGLVSARRPPNPMKCSDLPRLGRCSAMSGLIGYVKLCLTLFYTLGLLYWVGLGNINPTQILLYWAQ